ncbi:MAG: hypothetical protein MJ082_05230 [Clostridia bacterium]|nr:hypothetical protein [Clostridia bacterium]
MKKTLFILLIIAFVAVFALGASAEEIAKNALSEPAEEVGMPSSEDASEAKNEVAADQPENYENAFETVFRTLRAHAAELFAGASAILSVGLVFFIKKGLIPMLKSGLSALGNAAVKLKENSQHSAESVSETVDNVNNALQSLTKTVETVLSDMEQLAEKLEAIPEVAEKQNVCRTVLLSEVEMLGDIFMSSSLPEYRKEIVGQKISAMKDALSATDEA